MVELLLDAKASAKKANKAGVTPLQRAGDKNFPKIAALLSAADQIQNDETEQDDKVSV